MGISWWDLLQIIYKITNLLLSNIVPHSMLWMEEETKPSWDLVRSTMSACHLPKSLWGEVLKTVAYILHRILSKSVPKTCSCCGLEENLAWITIVFGVVWQKSKYIICNKGNRSQIDKLLFIRYTEIKGLQILVFPSKYQHCWVCSC